MQFLKRHKFLCAITAVIIITAATLWVIRPKTGPIDETVKNALFGTVHVLGETRKPHNIVILVADSGWPSEMQARAKAFASHDALVVGVSALDFLGKDGERKDACSELAKSFRKLTKFIERRYGYEDYVFPVLVGEGRGATLVYAALAQATPKVFAGAISFGFCPVLQLSKPVCVANDVHYTSTNVKDSPLQTYIFTRPPSMSEPWDVFMDSRVKADCPAAETQKFVGGMKQGALRNVSKGDEWISLFQKRMKAMVDAQNGAVTADLPDALKDLPLAFMDISNHHNKPMAIIVSGDGGWVRIDRGLGAAFNKKGVAVVGLDSLRYFWSLKTPDELGQDMGRIIDYYNKAWSPSSIILVGYSRGADVLPFAVSRLTDAQRSKIKTMALLAPGDSTKFKFEFMDWLPIKPLGIGSSVKSEILKVPGNINTQCFYGKADSVTDSVCPALDPARYKIFPREGDHHFNQKYDELIETVLSH